MARRTNNLQEQEFRKVKQGCRRLHGRGHLKRYVDEMPAGAVLLQNLKRAAYRRTVYGDHGESEMAARFAQVDPVEVAEVMRSWRRDRSTCRLPRKLERARNLPTRLTSVLEAASRVARTPA